MNTSGKNRAGYKGRLIALLATLLFGLPAGADDTELYFGKPSSNKPAPLVMLTLDYNPAVANKKVCGDLATCQAYMGNDIAAELDPVTLASGKVTLFDSFRAVFKLVFDTGVFDDMKVGLMMNHKADNLCTTGSTGCSNGGYVMRGLELFEKAPSDTNRAKAELLDIMAALSSDNNGVTHFYQGRELFFEMYRYLAGLDVLNGHLGYTDFGGASTVGKTKPPVRNLDYEFSTGYGSTTCAFTKTYSGDNRMCTDYVESSDYTLATSPWPPSHLTTGGLRISSALTWDLSIETTPLESPAPARYKDPFQDGDWSCSGVFSINLMFLNSQLDTDSDTALAKPLAEQGLGLPKATGTEDGFSQVIAKLHNMDIRQGQVGTSVIGGNQSLTSYFLVDKVDEKTIGYASAGGTKAIAAMSDPRKLLTALQGIGSEINGVSSSYVAVTVPVNADNRVTSLPNLFVALFQVDETGKPFWPGNVKKLKVVETPLSDGSIQLDVNDANGVAAFNPITGRLKDTALTFWTKPDAADVVAFDATKGEITGKDGSSVRRGGAGHKIPGYISPGNVGLSNSDPGARQIFLDPATVDGSLAVGNPMVPLDACDSTDTDNTCLFDDPEIQALLGIRDPTGACPGWDGATDNYCLTFIDSVLVAANAASGVTTSAAKAERATLMFLKWIRGYDVFNEAATSPAPVGTTTTVQRKWLMGDVLHSRPLAVNYGARPPGGGGYGTLNQDVRLVFGSNDGMLRMVRNTETGAADPSATTQRGTAYGAEVWAFMPRELLAHVPELAKNFGNVGLNRPYGADGQPTLFTIDTNGDGIIDNDGSCAVGDPDCDRAWVYFGLRRGGKSYYAVDISNPDATTPNLLWKVNEGTTGFTELGMTFSSPRVGWVRFEDVVRTPRLNLFLLDGEEKNVPVPVAIFGGGYNGHAVTSGDHHHSGTGGPSKDTILDTPFIGADTNEGNAIFIVHARTGELIWKATLGTAGATATNYQNASMEHGIAAPVSPMDSDGNGMLDRLYVADTGGRVWRVDIPEFVPPSTPAPACLSTSADATTRFSTCDHRADTWKATVMADLRPTTTAGLATDDLRFFHGATIIRRARDDIRTYDAIAVGSGDREHPQSEVSKRNWFFLFKDPFITSGDPLVTDTSTTPFPYDATSGADGLHDVTDDCFNGASGGGCDAADLENGWKLALEETGEKNLSESFAGGNGIIFTTYLPQGTGPDDAQCVPLGASRLYQVSLESGAPLKFLHDVVGDSFSKTDRWINLYSGIDGGVVAVSPDHWITSSGKSGENPPQKQVGFYWRESGVDTVK